MKTVNLLTSAVIAGEVRYPIEGPLLLSDDDAEHLVENGQGEIVEYDDEDSLDDFKVDDLKKLAEDEKIDLGSFTKKADIISAIRAARAGETEE